MLRRSVVQFCSAPLVHFPSALDRLTARSNATPGREAASAPVRPSVSDELDAKEKGWFYYSTILGR